jgi:hypothetical protein
LLAERQGSKQEKSSPEAWDLVCRPKDKGVLGVVDLKIKNNCLLMKHLSKFYNHEDLPWIDLIW